MKKFLEILSMIALLVWGGVFIWFYASGRIDRYLDPSFRIFALLAGIGLIVLALFNLMMRNHAAGACNHEHAHGDSCDHDHGDHHHHEHEHGHDCCEDDHGHEHHSHDHDHDHDTTATGITFSLLVLLIPVLMAARYSDDRFSLGYITKWAKIEQKMLQMRLAKNRATPQAITETPPPASKENNPYAAPAVTEKPAPATEPKKVVDAPPAKTEAKTDPDSKTVAKADTPPETKKETSPADKPASKETDAGWDEFTLEDLKKMVPQSSDGNFLLDVPQIFYTAGDDELMKVMEGISVETTAQVMPETENNPKNTRLRAFRLFIECCAADARPLSIPIEFGKAVPKYKEMGWYKIFGKLHFSRENDEIIPLLNIEKIVETIEPIDGMMY